jgi:hypothetical protein
VQCSSRHRGSRRFAQQLFIDTEHAVDGAFAIRMCRELKSGEPGLARVVVQFFASAAFDAEVVRQADVRLGQPRGPLRDRAVGVLFDSADAHHGITETAVQTRCDVAIQIAKRPPGGSGVVAVAPACAKANELT